MTESIIIGNRDDLHVRHVLDRLECGGTRAIVVDAESIANDPYKVTAESIVFDGATVSSRWRGWIRRYAPDGWMTDCELGSLEGVTNRARLTLINHVAGSADIRWLTSRWCLTKAEERMFQLRVAETLGINVPRFGRDDEEIREAWSDFIYSHHYDIVHSFFESSIANHPRRTGEAYWNTYLFGELTEDNTVPRDFQSLDQLVAWYLPLLSAERMA